MADFKFALTALKNGARVHRSEWVIISYVTYLPGYPEGILANENNQKAHCIAEGSMLTYEPYFQGCLVNGGNIIVWSPSTQDILAEDWEAIE